MNINSPFAKNTKEILRLLCFSNTNILYCFYGAFELTPYVSHKIRFLYKTRRQ
jgi:hypothetical protein